jgi:hypothetical protein
VVKARALIGGANYDPNTLKRLYRAFDDAWAQIAPHIPNHTDTIESARMKLAEIVIDLAQNGTRDAEALTDAAVQRMLADPTKPSP